jgi:dCMP deaminase
MKKIVANGKHQAKRPSKEKYYLEIARSVAERGTCICISFGVVIVRDDQIISTGYVGAPRKTKDCMELGYCIRRKKNVPSGSGYEMCRSVHAEMNAIINSARAGVSLLGGDLYLHTSQREKDGSLSLVKAYPCLLCKKMIINSGIKRFIGNEADGSVSIYDVDNWIKDWQEIEDITLSKDQYKTNYEGTGLLKKLV